MVVEYESEAGAFYLSLVADGEVARTVEVAALVNVDLAADRRVVGIELVGLPTPEDRAALVERFPMAADALAELDRLTSLSA